MLHMFIVHMGVCVCVITNLCTSLKLFSMGGHLIFPINRERPYLPQHALSTNYYSSDHSQQCFRVLKHRGRSSQAGERPHLRPRLIPRSILAATSSAPHPMFQCWKAATWSAMSLINLIMILPLLNGFLLSTGIRPNARIKHKNPSQSISTCFS